jgi:hypothetical protein
VRTSTASKDQRAERPKDVGSARPWAGTSSGSAAGHLVMSCKMTSPDIGRDGLTGGRLNYGSSQITTSRLGVTGQVREPDGQITATWAWGWAGARSGRAAT